MNDPNTLKRIVGGLKPSDISSISNENKINSAINIVTAASAGQSLSSVQVNKFIFIEIIYICTYNVYSNLEIICLQFINRRSGVFS